MTLISKKEQYLWLALALAFIAWTVTSPSSLLFLLALAMFVYAAYDFYGSPLSRANISSDRLFSAFAISFIISLSWLDFATALTFLVVIMTVMWIVYRKVYCTQVSDEKPLFAWADLAKNYAPMLLVIWLIRSFLLQPYHVPTGSLEPSILPHELILVKQFSYGLRLPAWPFSQANLFNYGEPKRGDIALFRAPHDEKTMLVKRVIGLPGDHIKYQDQKLYINGRLSDQIPVNETIAKMIDAVPHSTPQTMAIEKLADGPDHYILLSQGEHHDGLQSDWVVPEHHYFMMGDNRDNSYDSRYWGFVPEKNFVGKAWFVFMSWDHNHRVRWDRFGTQL